MKKSDIRLVMAIGRALLMTVSIANFLANLPGHLVGHLSADLPWDFLASLSGHLNWHLPGNLAAHLLRHAVADSLCDVSDNVCALGLRDLGALWDWHQTLVLDWDLLARPPDLSLASRGMGQDPSLSLTLEDWVSSCQWASRNSSDTSNSNRLWANNRLNCYLTLDSNQGSLFTNLCLDVLALIDQSGLNNGLSFSDTFLTVGCAALLVSDLPDNWVADLLRNSVADIVVLSCELSFSHSLADGFGHCSTLL